MNTHQPSDSSQTTGLCALLTGGLAALLASACCLGPLLLISLGISGAWIGHLTELGPLQPVFLGAAVLGGEVGLIYDRGSFVALEPSMRPRYLAGINGILHAAPATKPRHIFLNAVERVASDDRDALGPPFHVEPSVVFEGYASLGGEGRGVAFVVPLGQPEKLPDDPRPFFDSFYAVIKM